MQTVFCYSHGEHALSHAFYDRYELVTGREFSLATTCNASLAHDAAFWSSRADPVANAILRETSGDMDEDGNSRVRQFQIPDALFRFLRMEDDDDNGSETIVVLASHASVALLDAFLVKDMDVSTLAARRAELKCAEFLLLDINNMDRHEHSRLFVA